MAARPLAAVAVAALFVLGAGTARAATPVASVDIVKVQGVIDPAQGGYIEGAIADAATRRSTVVLQLDSVGAYAGQEERVARAIAASPVPIVAWIGPSGSRVEGAAVPLAYDTSIVTMAPGAGLGPILPALDLGGGQLPEGRRDLSRILAAAPSDRAVARLEGGPAFPAGPALDEHLISFVSPSIPDLLKHLDGRTVRPPNHASAVTLRTLNGPGRPVEVSFHEIGIWRRILHGVSAPGATYVLLVLGVMAVAFELTQPAFGVAGISGGLALALGGYGLAVIPVHWLGIGLLLAGLGLMGIDVLIKRVAALTALGAAAFAVGSVLAWHGVAPPIRVAGWFIGVATAAAVLFFGFGLTVALRSRQQFRTAQVGLLGLVGEVRTDLNPEGGVYVKGTLWRARSNDGPIPKGARVRIRGIDGLILRVEREPGD